MRGLLGPDGEPIAPEVIARLREPEAAPTPGGMRSVFSDSPAEGLTPRRLASIHRAAANGDTLAAIELAEDIEERDLHYVGVLGTRRRQVAQLQLTVEAVSDDAEHVAHADFIRRWIGDGVLEDALFDMLDAIGKGYSVHEIEWDVSAAQIVPRALTYRPPRWFEVSRVDGDTVMLRDPVATTSAALAASLSPPGAALALAMDAGLVPLSPHKFLVHKSRAKSGILQRAGLARVASWGWMYKAFTIRDWAIFTQNFGMPLRLGRYGPEASPEERRVLWRAVSSIAGDCAAIVPKGMDMEFISPASQAAAAEVYERRADWIDRQVSKAVLGQTQTTDATSGGHAAGQTHRLVQEDIERADARALAVTIRRQLISRMIAFNFPEYIAKGGRHFPRLLIGRPDELPIREVTTALQWLGPQGLTVSVSELRDRLGFSDPDPDEAVVGGAPPPAAVPTISPPHVGRATAPGHGAVPAEAAHSMLAGLRSRTAHPATVAPELLDRLQQRVELDAQGALAGLTEQVRGAIEQATDLEDLRSRLEQLQLDTAAFAEAMQRGIALAHLVGQAALLDELRGT